MADFVRRQTSPAFVDEALEALDYFHSLVGDLWTRQPSPLAGQMLTGFQGREPEMLRLRRLLRALADDPNISAVETDLIGPSEEGLSAARTVLEVAGTLRSHVEVELLPRSQLPTADYRVRIDGRWVNVESTGLHETEASKRARYLHQALDTWGIENGVRSVGMATVEFRGFIDEAEASVPSAQAAILRLMKGGVVDRRVEVDSQTTVELNMGNTTGPWAVLMLGPLIDVYEHAGDKRETTRLLRAIRRKRRQLAGGQPGIVYVETDGLFWEYEQNRTAAFHHVTDRLLGELTDHPVISAVVLSEKWLGTPERTHHAGDGRYTATWGSPNGLNRAVLYVPNPATACPLTPREQDVWIGPSMRW
jgi:hypothetical protein